MKITLQQHNLDIDMVDLMDKDCRTVFGSVHVDLFHDRDDMRLHNKIREGIGVSVELVETE